MPWLLVQAKQVAMDFRATWTFSFPRKMLPVQSRDVLFCYAIWRPNLFPGEDSTTRTSDVVFGVLIQLIQLIPTGIIVGNPLIVS